MNEGLSQSFFKLTRRAIRRQDQRWPGLFCTLLLLSVLPGCDLEVHQHSADPPAPLERPATVITVAPASAQSLDKVFSELDYSWENLDRGVPPLYLERLPVDLKQHRQGKKRLFFMGLLPMVLMANEEIANEREQLLDILGRYQSAGRLELEERRKLDEMAKEYRISVEPLGESSLLQRLLKRVDIIPPSLVLAQAANESAWGTSRFAREGNNLFGQWTFTPGTGIVPRNRPQGARYEVRKFASLYDSVRSYINNLNTHEAYLDLRNIRMELREKGKQVSGRDLVKGLQRYSIRRDDYITEIDQMIRYNRLSRFNSARLRSSSAAAQSADSGQGGYGLFSTRVKLAGLEASLDQNPEL
ncbi:MAG: hypothetical protein C0614_02805 [Desulfuromonas sp.]|nr:MAG: hypothetical protein C0614_02805 [Desulfuromonas sp.]